MDNTLRKAAEMLMKALDDGWVERGDSVVIALRQALAQPEQEPTVPDNMQDWANLDGDIVWHLIDRHADNWADIQKMMDEFVAAKIASAHLKHEWVSLTDEEIEQMYVNDEFSGSCKDVYQAIEAKLKEKNNG